MNGGRKDPNGRLSRLSFAAAILVIAQAQSGPQLRRRAQAPAEAPPAGGRPSRLPAKSLCAAAAAVTGFSRRPRTGVRAGPVFELKTPEGGADGHGALRLRLSGRRGLGRCLELRSRRGVRALWRARGPELGRRAGPATWAESGLANLAGAGQARATRQTWLANWVVELGRRSGLRGGAGAAGAVTRRGLRCRCGAALAAALGSRPPPRGPEPAPGSDIGFWGLTIDQAPRRPRSLHALNRTQGPGRAGLRA